MQQQFKYIQCNFVLKPTQIKSEPLRILDFDKAAWIGRAHSLVGPRWNLSTNKQCLIDPISRIDWNWKLFWLHCWWWWCQSLSSTGELCLGLQGIFTMTMMEGITVMLVMLPDTLAAAATFWMNFSKNWGCWRVQWLHKYFLVPGHFHRLEKEKYLHSFNLSRRILY